ncbi:hypothetical protein Tco_0818472 [Tanacetum coccineum]
MSTLSHTLLWEHFVYQLENQNVKRSNEMYYPRFTKVIINFFINKDQSIPRRNKVNWHFARDDPMFTMIKVVSRHEDTQLYGAILPNELTNEAIKDSESYKLLCHCFKEQTSKTKASTNEGTSNKLGVPDVPTYASDDKRISWKSSDEEDDNEVAMSGDDDDDADNQDDDDNDDDDQNDDNTNNENDDNDDDDGQDHDDEEIQSANVEGEELDKERDKEEDKAK